MKKIKLLFAAFAAMVTMGVNAQSWTASEVEAGNFMLYNVGTGQYFTRGNGWNTQASITTAATVGNGLAVELIAVGDNFKIRTGINNDAYGLENLSGGTVYTDQSRDKNSSWIFTQVGTDNGPVYNIVSADNHGGGSGAYLTAGVDGTIVTPGNDGTIDGAKWKLMSLPAQPVGMADASEENPVDATSFIVNANFSFPTILKSDSWTMVSSNYNACGGNVDNPCAESWRASFTLSQTITVPNGIYELTAQAAVTEYTVTGANLPVVYAGDQSTPFTAMTEGENSMGGVSTSFTAGKYVVGPIRVVVTNGSLTIGVRGTRTDTWCVWDNFKLTYKGVDLTELKNALQTQIDAVPALEGTTTTAAYNAAKNYADGIDMDALTTEEAISTASTELANLVNAAKALQANFARYNAVKAAALAIAESLDTTTHDAALNAATTDDAIETAIASLRATFLAELPNLTIPADPGYIDVTSVMVDNASVSQNTDYWTKGGTPNGGYSFGVCNYGECEFYNCNFKFFQTLALARGTWEFGVTGFHRAGNHNTHFYAGVDKILIPGVANTVVNSMAQAKDYFDAGNGMVALKFVIESDQDVEIGIDNQDTETDKWTIFRNFTLKYYGAPDYSVYDAQWADAITAANAAKAAHPVLIAGAEEYDALDAAIADAPDGSSKANYFEKIGALEAATSAFIAAAPIYEAYPTALANAKKTAAKEDPMQDATLTALNNAIETYDEGKVDTTDKEAVQAATVALNTAIANVEASIANYAEAKAILDAANIYDAAGQASYAANETIATIQAAYDNNTLESVTNEQKAAAQVALATACKAQIQPADGCDMTPFIDNPNFDSNATGWTTEKTGNGWTAEPYNVDNHNIEYWSPSVIDENVSTRFFDYYQTITGLPNGAYTISADMLNSTNKEENEDGHEAVNWNGGGNAGVYSKTAADEKRALITINDQTFRTYTTSEILVFDGELRIGVKNINPLTGRWFACDNFKLTYVRQLTDEEKEAVAKAGAVIAYNEALAAAQAIEEGTIPSDAYTTLQTAITNNTLADGTSTEYNAAATALNEATTAATPLVAPYAAYKAMKTAVSAMTSVEGYTETVSGATTTLTSAISTADAAVEAATAAATITEQTDAVKAAGLTFLAGARSDGAHPFDITFLISNPDFATDATTGWKYDNAPGYGHSAGEFYQTTFDFNQTISGLPKGNYELKVQAFQRPGWPDNVYADYMAGNDNVTAEIYINEGSTSVQNICASAQNTAKKGEADGEGNWPGWPADSRLGLEGAYKYVPNSMEGASLYFAAGLYDNSVLVAVEGDLKFGFRSSTMNQGYWIIFDNFRLYYYGQSINVAMSETENFVALADIEGANVTMDRTTKVGFNTVALPFDLTEAQVAEVFGEDAVVYEFSEDSADPDDATVEFNTKSEQTIEANVPVLVKATQAATQIVADNVTVKTGEAKAEGTNFDFVGNYSGEVTIQAGDWFIGNNAVYKSAGATKIKGFRAYMKDKTNGVASVKMYIDGLETSINEINGEAAENAAIYNIAGQRVNKVQKGIYIVNGKKVLVK